MDPAMASLVWGPDARRPRGDRRDGGGFSRAVLDSGAYGKGLFNRRCLW